MVKIHKDILNQRAANVPGRSMTPKYITVHNTANSSKGADAKMHARYQKNGSGGRQASWHYQVDDKEIWQSLEDTQQGWHAGDGQGSGNTESIGIEICENSDGDFNKAVANAQSLIKHLMDKHNIPLKNVVTHKHWSGKNCPRLLLNSWDKFTAGIDGQTKKPAASPTPSKPKSKTIAQMAAEVIAGNHGQGHANRRKSLGISQSEYEKVRAKVNRRAGVSSPSPSKPKGKTIAQMAQMAQEVIDGKHGNGHANRRKSLGISQAEYNKVRDEVNRRAGGTPRKSISQMASEVIAGKHGNGHANRRKSLGISQAEYNKVRAEVNRRA